MYQTEKKKVTDLFRSKLSSFALGVEMERNSKSKGLQCS